MTISKQLLKSKLITDEQWEEYQIFKQSKEMTLNKISIVTNKIKNVIKDINDILEYIKNDEVWQEYSKMHQLFMNTYNTCLIADTKKEIK